MQPTPASGRGGRRTLAVTYGGRVRACCRCSRGREVRRGSAREVRSIRSARCISAHHALVPLCRARRDWRINLSRARRRPLGSSFLFVSFRLATLGRFTDTLYLSPEPAEPLIVLAQAVLERFPRYLPYGGQFPSVVPHFTVARGSGDDLAFAERTLSSTLTAGGIQAQCREVVLIENSSSRWERMHAFRLSSVHQLDG